MVAMVSTARNAASQCKINFIVNEAHSNRCCSQRREYILLSKMRRHASKLRVGKNENVMEINSACQERHYRASGLVQSGNSEP